MLAATLPNRLGILIRCVISVAIGALAVSMPPSRLEGYTLSLLAFGGAVLVGLSHLASP